MRRNSLIISFLCPAFLFAQKAEKANSSLFELRKSLEPTVGFAFFEPSKAAVFSVQRLALPDFFELEKPRPASVLSQKFCADDLAFFCRIEHRVAKKSPTAFKFRLGSVEHVDFLEGKRRWSAGQ